VLTQMFRQSSKEINVLIPMSKKSKILAKELGKKLETLKIEYWKR
jgi:hypothetical protein